MSHASEVINFVLYAVSDVFDLQACVTCIMHVNRQVYYSIAFCFIFKLAVAL